MTNGLLTSVLVPVAGPDDAAASADAIVDGVAAANGRVTVVHVVEKAGGAMDKAGVEQREGVAEEAFEVFERACAARDVPVDTDIAYGTDVADAIIAAAADVDASAIAFTPRGGSRLLELITGDVANALIHRSDRPVVMFPAKRSDE